MIDNLSLVLELAFIFILNALACYRLSLMVSKERGPGGIFAKLRNIPDPEKHEFIWEGVRCLWCVSVWMAGAITIYAIWVPWVSLVLAPIYWLAMSSVTIILDQIFTKSK